MASPETKQRRAPQSLDDELPVAVELRLVHGDPDGAERERRVADDGPLEPVVADDGEAVAAVDAAGGQRGARAIDEAAELGDSWSISNRRRRACRGQGRSPYLATTSWSIVARSLNRGWNVMVRQSTPIGRRSGLLCCGCGRQDGAPCVGPSVLSLLARSSSRLAPAALKSSRARPGHHRHRLPDAVRLFPRRLQLLARRGDGSRGHCRRAAPSAARS